MLVLDGLTKDFATRAVDAVSLEFKAGKVHALLGANGAGKSTLSKMIAGILQPTLGKMILSKAHYTPKSKLDAQQLGVQIVQQELNIFPTLSLAENLFFSKLPSRFGMLDRRAMSQRAEEILHDFGLGHHSPNTPASRLGVGERQILEIAANTWQDTKLLILDEPTAALSIAESETLFGKIDQWKQSGVAILYISHRLAEIQMIADEISILRDGKLQGTWLRGQLDQRQIVDQMSDGSDRTDGTDRSDQSDVSDRTYGTDRSDRSDGSDRTDGTDRSDRSDVSDRTDRTDRSDRSDGSDRTDGTDRSDRLLVVENLSVGTKVKDVSLTVVAGQILGVAGLVGSGRSELLRAIFGADRTASGYLRLPGKELRLLFRNPREAVRAGVAMISEDRKADGLLLSESIAMNVQLPMLDIAPFGSLSLYGNRQAHMTAEGYCDQFNIRCESTHQSVGTLSGGNQQKVVLAKWLHRGADVFLLDEPTRGIDIASRELVYRVIRELAGAGKGVLVVSSDLEELMGLCDQIGVLSNGKWVTTFPGPEFDSQRIVQAMFAGYDGLSNQAT